MTANENFVCNEDSLYNRSQSTDKSLLTSLLPVSAIWQYAICGVTATWLNEINMKNYLDLVQGKFVKFHDTFLEMQQLESTEHLHAVVYHFDTLASSFSKSQIYIYSNVFSAVKVDTA